MVREPMPEALESKLFCVPFSVTVTAPGLPARTVIESVTVYFSSHGPVTVLATSLEPSFVISSQEVSPLATETVTTVSCAVSPLSAVDESLSAASSLVVVVVVVVVDVESVEESDDVESVDVVLTGTVDFDSLCVVLLPTHERTERMRMSVRASARARITRSIERRLS